MIWQGIPSALRAISEKTGLNIIMGGAYYHFPSLPEQTKAFILDSGVNGLADFFIRELEEGVAGTGIRPGLSARWARARTRAALSLCTRPPSRSGKPAYRLSSITPPWIR